MGAYTNRVIKSSKPELERHIHRDIELGYEPQTGGFLRVVEHGSPSPLIRWHQHEEYELHLITATRGKLFVGDHIGTFEPGNLVLTGPQLPHNWITTDYEEGQAAPERDRCLIFLDEPIRNAAQLMPELRSIFPLLERAKRGIEFIGISERVSHYLDRIRDSSGIYRLSVFFELFSELAQHPDFRLLSSAPIDSSRDTNDQSLISDIVGYISDHYNQPLCMADVAKRYGMSESGFSRYFRKETGNSFTDFVNRLRVAKACHLLMETEKYISTICYEVGYNTVANFNRRFSELHGMTPSAFRQQSKLRLLHS